VFENNLANEEHIVKKSKTHHYKLNPRMRRTEEKIKPLAKQIGPFWVQNSSLLLVRQARLPIGSLAH
jgi:hypothetical protein